MSLLKSVCEELGVALAMLIVSVPALLSMWVLGIFNIIGEIWRLIWKRG